MRQRVDEEANGESYTPRVTRSPAEMRWLFGWTWVASIALHVVLLGGFGWLAFRSLHARERRTAESQPRAPIGSPMATIAIELPTVAEGSLLAPKEPDPRGDPPQLFGGAETPRLDTGSSGRGGDTSVQNPAVNLSDTDDRMRLAQSTISRLDRDQEQRIHSSERRASREDRRSTTHPMELTFLATGRGQRQERRAPSASDPSRGAARSAAASVRGGSPGSARAPEPGLASSSAPQGASREGSTDSSSGRGVRDTPSDRDHRAQAAVALARPDVPLAAVSVPASAHGRPNDDVDSEQEVATTVRSLVHASTAGGIDGDGRGGSGGGGDPGAGGAYGFGSHARPMGLGESEWFDLNTNDPRLVPYFRRIHRRVDPLWANAFPKSALLELKQGTVILEVTIAANGVIAIAWPPLRPSGIDEFDRNCYEALRRAGPFDPIPMELGRTSLKVRMPFDAQNPIVR